MMRAAGGQQVRTEVDGLLQAKNELLDREIALKGLFPKEIERMQKLKAECEQKLGMIATVEDAAKVKKEADAYAAKTVSEADGLKASASETNAKATKREAEVAKREQQVAMNAEQVANHKAANEQREAAFHAQTARQEQELDKRSGLLAKAEADLATRRAALEAREQEFQKRLEAVRAPV